MPPHEPGAPRGRLFVGESRHCERGDPMDEAGFRELLGTRHLEPPQVERSVAAVRRFEEFLQRCRPGATAAQATAGDVERFLEELDRTAIHAASDPAADALAIGRYALLTHNDEVLVAVLERIDGAEVPANLSRTLAELVGEERRDEVFAGLEIPPISAPGERKSAFMRQLVERLVGRIDAETVTTALTSGLHFVPREAFAEERTRFLAAPDIDAFLEDEHRRYIEHLANLKDEGTLYYTQPITDDVLDYVRATPTCGGGVRRGDEIHVTKIPYQADLYVHETDEVRRRYLYCHCPWARESILHPGAMVSARFCECSAGFEKQYWDAVLDEPVRVDVVLSVLQGDPVCEFAVRLPEHVVRARSDRPPGPPPEPADR
jgi:hypothetical protein